MLYTLVTHCHRGLQPENAKNILRYSKAVRNQQADALQVATWTSFRESVRAAFDVSRHSIDREASIRCELVWKIIAITKTLEALITSVCGPPIATVFYSS